MIILDTNVLSHVQKKDPFGIQIETILAKSADRTIRITSISSYEIMKGAVSLINRERKARKSLIQPFRLYDEVVEKLLRWNGLVLPYDKEADKVYNGFSPRIRQEIGADGWIAAIAQIHNATVWTRNVRDFTKIPGLAVVDALTGLPIENKPDPA